MEYRQLGSTGLRVSVLGFGCIKFSRCGQDDVTAALHRALDLGVNLFDTARNYGDSEEKIGLAIAARRDEFVLSTKSAARDAAGLLDDLETSLRNLRTETVDLLYLHTVSTPEAYEQVMAPGGALEGARTAKGQGKVRHIAVSVHRDLETMGRTIDCGCFEALMPAYSVIDSEHTEAMLARARDAGMGTVIMKALSGGGLVSPPRPDGSPVSPDPVVAGALRWVISNPCVSSVIPGMISAAQVEQNVAAAEKGSLSDEERQELIGLVGRLKKSYRYGQTCLHCDYCQPCPQGINISAVFRAADMAQNYPPGLRHVGGELFRDQKDDLDSCTQCRTCMKRCPAGIAIPDRLADVAELFASAR